MTARPTCPRRRQRGLALVCALLLMLAVAIVAMSVARMALASLASAERERDRAVARAAAEAALRDGERAVAAGDAVAGGDAAVDAAGPDPGAPPWQTVDLAEPGGGATAYGAATGARLAVGGGLLPARLPAYLIERLAPAGGGPAQGTVFRITSIGFGARVTTQVVLQSLYRVPAPAGAGGTPPVAGARIGWRDIANWPELHARARR
jgi:type IV pilus assembly protein PilX